jgi:hypothetical protein
MTQRDVLCNKKWPEENDIETSGSTSGGFLDWVGDY